MQNSAELQAAILDATAAPVFYTLLAIGFLLGAILIGALTYEELNQPRNIKRRARR